MGTLTTSSINGLRKLNLEDYDIKLFIVRSPGKVKDNLRSKGFIHVPQLSPSVSLLAHAKTWEKNGIYNWFIYNYKPRFIQEMKDMQPYLKRITDHLNNGKNVLLVCFCGDPELCHRSIIAEDFIQKGYNTIIN